MPYVPHPLLKKAFDSLQGKHPFSVFVFPSMVKAGVDVVSKAENGREYGSADEIAVLEEYFRVPGAPNSEKPYRAIWEKRATEFWRDKQYPGRSVQRMRTDEVPDALFQAKKTAGVDKDLWGFKSDTAKRLTKIKNPAKVRIVDLALWYGRNQNVADLDELILWFKKEFPLNKADFMTVLYTDDVPGEYKEVPFSPEAVSQNDYAEILSSTPAATFVEGDFTSLCNKLVACLKSKRFQFEESLVQRVITAWSRGDIVVIMGQPGTGKTRFAQLLTECLEKTLSQLTSSWIAIRPDFDEAELIGYERLDGKAQLRDFSVQVLRSENPLAPHLVVLEEFNLASIENYLASILIATQDPERRVMLPAGEPGQLPVDTFILATCNSYLDDPETRLRVSWPSKRRSTIITMPNILYSQYVEHGEAVIIKLAFEQIEQERDRVARRLSNGLGASFDKLRLNALMSVGKADDLSIEVRTKLTGIVKALLDSPEGRDFFTLGLLRDVILNIALAPRDKNQELEALGQQVADKIIHQLRGQKQKVDAFQEAAKDLPNYQEIIRLLERMKSNPGDELISLL